jgi:hypothetical protein
MVHNTRIDGVLDLGHPPGWGMGLTTPTSAKVKKTFYTSISHTPSWYCA